VSKPKRKPKKVVNAGGRPVIERTFKQMVEDGVHFTHTSAKVPKGCRFQMVAQGVWPMWRERRANGTFYVEKRQQGAWRSRCQDCGKMHTQRSIHKRPNHLDKFPFSVFCDKCRTGKRGVTVLFRAYNQVPEAAEPLILDEDFNPVGCMAEDADAPVSAQEQAQAARVLNVFTVDTPDNREAAKWMSAANWDVGFKALVRSTIAGVQCEYMTEQFIAELANNG